MQARAPKGAVCAVLAALALISCRQERYVFVEDGSSPVISRNISNTQVNSICEDAGGHIWIATFRGLNKFAGGTFYQYFNDADSLSLPDNQIKALLSDSRGRLWASSVNGPAFISPDGSVTRAEVEGENRNIFSLAETDGGVILGNAGSALYRLNEERNVFERVIDSSDLGEYMVSAMLSPEGDLWLGCLGSLRCLNVATMTQRDLVPLEGGLPVHFCMLPDGHILISGYNMDLLSYDTAGRKFDPLPSSFTRRTGFVSGRYPIIYPYSEGCLLYSDEKGMFYYNDATGELSRQDEISFPFKAPDFKVSTMFTDSHGNLWIGSVDQGFDVIYSYKEPFNSSPLSGAVESTSVENILQDDDGNVWICTMTEGLQVYQPDGRLVHVDVGLTESFSGAKNSEISYVLKASDGSVWLASATSSKVFKCRYSAGRVIKERTFDVLGPMSLSEGSDGTVWASTIFSQILILRDGAEEFEPVCQMNGFAPGLLPLEDGRMMATAFFTPIKVIDPATGEAEDFKPFTDCYEDCIRRSVFIPTDIMKDSRGDIWVGTVANGLLRYDHASQKFENVEGVPCNDVEGILEDSRGDIWVSTQHGLGRWDRESGKFSNYFKADGIGGDQFFDRSRCILEGGDLVFGGTHGVTCFNPEEVDREIDVPLVFETLKIGNRLVRGIPRSGDRIVLDYDRKNFSIAFTALDYSEFDRLRYHYRMEGHEDLWVDAQNSREAFYGNLPAGRYRFCVRASSSDDDALVAENSIDILVRSAPWAAWWAWLLYALAAAALALVLWRQRSSINKEKAAALKAEEEKEQERRVNRMNMSFFANVSHEFRTPLTMIAGPVKQLSGSGNVTGGDRRLLGIVERNVTRMLRLVNQMLDFGKLEDDTLALKVSRADVVPYLQGVADTFAMSAEDKGIGFVTSGLVDSFEMWVDQDKLDKICYNLLSNAVKYTPAGGNITFGFDISGESVLITVSDNGQGIPEQYREKVFERYFQVDSQPGGTSAGYNYGTGIGLYYARSLARLHHGDLTVGPGPDGTGCTFTLSLPAGEDIYSDSEKNSEDPRLFASGGIGRLEDSPSGGDETGPRILVVDDDIEVAGYLRDLLSPKYGVTCRFDPSSAFSTLKEERIDLVMSDVVMPGGTGYDLCRRIKDEMELCHIPVILVTAKTAIDDQVEGLNCGADAYVTKPFDPDYVLALVQSQLSNRERLRGILTSATHTGDIADESLSDKDKAFMDELYALMESEMMNSEMDVAAITEKMKISRTKLYYKVKGLTGENPSVFFKLYKLNRASQLIRERKYTMSEIADMTGFSTLSHFSTSFKKQFGVPPSEY